MFSFDSYIDFVGEVILNRINIDYSKRGIASGAAVSRVAAAARPTVWISCRDCYTFC